MKDLLIEKVMHLERPTVMVKPTATHSGMLTVMGLLMVKSSVKKMEMRIEMVKRKEKRMDWRID